MKPRFPFLIGLLVIPTLLLANHFDYQLAPVQIADGTYVLEGKREDFTFDNGGNIVNTAFIVTAEGVVVIDSGPSFRYGKQMIEAIRQITDAPIVRVFNTHHHPDHFLGNQVFDSDRIYALAATRQAMTESSEAFTDNAYRMSGNWMKGTEPKLPTHSIEQTRYQIGSHRLHLMPMAGHTVADLAILDESTGVLFTSDLVFDQRAATTPHANIPHWLNALDVLDNLTFKILVPGHGPISHDKHAIAQTRDYLTWLQARLNDAAASGLDMIETMALPIPERFEDIALVRTEFTRSVSHLFPAMEAKVFQRTKQSERP